MSTQSLTIGRASDLMTENEFTSSTHSLLQLGHDINKSVGIRTHEDLEQYYNYSIVALLGDKCVANTSCHPAAMVPENIPLSEYQVRMGESSSVIVHPEHQGQGIGKNIFQFMQNKIVENEFDAVIGGTISPQMKHIRNSHGYHQIAFPGTLYDEGRKFFESLVGREYFEEHAYCGLFEHEKLSENTKRDLTLYLANL